MEIDAVISLIFFTAFIQIIFDLSNFQLISAVGISIIIFIYNYIFLNYFKKIENVVGLVHVRFSVVQIAFDLIALSCMIYITGGIETPLFLFYFFHMIIGAIILPKRIIYSLASILITIVTILTIWEYIEIIPHQGISGLYTFSLYSEINFIIGFLIFFSIVVLISIYLTQQIASDLYDRERQLKVALEEIKEAEKSKQKYIMAVIHELKSPIAAAISFLDIILEGYLGEVNNAIKDKLQKTRDRTEQTIEKINNILRISKYKLLNAIENENIDLIELINKVIFNLEEIVSRKRIDLKFENNIIENNYLHGDKVLLNLVFSNLIGNAVKYTPENGKVEVKLEQSIDHFKVSISDTGIGIPSGEWEKVFEEFYRATNTSNNKYEGTGTGLSVVKQILESHNGQIEIESPSKIGSKDSPGTTFILILPFRNE